MSSTDLAAPSRKLLLTAIMIVVGLHVFTVVALAAIKTPELKIDKKETPPIEIEQVTPPPVEVEEIKVEEIKVEEEKPEPVRKLDTKPKAKPVTAPSTVKQTKTPKDSSNKKSPAPSPSNNNPTDELPSESINNKPADNEKPNLGGVVDNSTTTVIKVNKPTAQKPTIDTSTNSNQGVNKPSSVGDGSKNTGGGNEGGNQQETQSPVDTGPVSFGASEASWRSEPQLGFLANERSLKKKGSISVTAAITADEKGNITKVSISPSTGISSVDNKIIRAIKKAKLTPFIRNGVAVRGRVSVPVSYVIS